MAMKLRSYVTKSLTKNSASTWSEVENCGCDSPMSMGSGDDGSYAATEHAVRAAFREVNPMQYDPDTGAMLSQPYVVAVFEGHLIYRDGGALYRAAWAAQDGLYTIGDESEQVVKEVEYVPVGNAGWTEINAA